MNNKMCFLFFLILFNIVCRCFLNLLWNFVFVMSVFIFNVKIVLFFNFLGIFFFMICCVSFLMIVVLLIFGFLIKIGLFFVLCERI